MTAGVLDFLQQSYFDDDGTPFNEEIVEGAVRRHLAGQGSATIVRVTPIIPLAVSTYAGAGRVLRQWRWRVDEATADVSGSVGQRHPGVVAADDLMEWLGLTIGSTMALAGLSEPTYHWWQKRPDSEIKPNKGGRLLRLHSVLGYLVAQYGPEPVRAWLMAPDLWACRTDPEAFVSAVGTQGMAWLRQSRVPRRTFNEADWNVATGEFVMAEAQRIDAESSAGRRTLGPVAP